MHDHEPTPTASHRHDHEAEVYDARAAEMLATLPDEAFVIDAAAPPFPNREHVEFLTAALERLGRPAGRHILEVGCGTGSLATFLALRGAVVHGIDVSSGNVDVARHRASVSGAGARATFSATPIEHLDLPDGSFDAVVGNQVLHHVDLPTGMANIARLLRPGGMAVFCEPILLLPEAVRRVRNSGLVTRRFPMKTDTPDERSISTDDLAVMEVAFGNLEWQPFQVLCRLQNFVPLGDAAFERLQRIDRTLLRTVPPARRLARYALIVLTRRSSPS